MNETNNGFQLLKDDLKVKEPAPHKQLMSDNYTCHVFDKAGQLYVCTAEGEIIVCDTDGCMQYYLTDAPFGNYLECIYPASRGLVVAGANGFIWSYEKKTSFDYGIPYSLLQSKIGIDEKSIIHQSATDSITSICLSEPEDALFTINRNNQLQTTKFSYDREKGGLEAPKMKYLHSMFHATNITGMDICLRK